MIILVFPINKHYANLGDTILPDISFWNLDGGPNLIKRARVDLGVVNDGVPTHEFGHVFIASNPWTYGHSTLNPRLADEKAGKIVYEDTYHPGEPLNNILGTTF